MDDTRVYAGYFTRLAGLIIALILLGLAIWFVVQLFSDGEESGVVLAPEDDGTAYSVTDSATGDDLVITGSDDDVDSRPAADSRSATAGSTTTAGNLPDTGPGDSLLMSVAIGSAVLAANKYRRSRQDYL